VEDMVLFPEHEATEESIHGKPELWLPHVPKHLPFSMKRRYVGGC